MTTKGHVLFEQDALQMLESMLIDSNQRNQKVFLLTDENCYTHCLPLLEKMLRQAQPHWHLIQIPSGENHKNLATTAIIWEKLTEQQAGRDALLINLGGGVITDIGGFAASCYKRGIRTLHIPTTLLAMTDAAIGGKTGIDFDFYKNHIGTFYLPEFVLIFPDFLQSLDHQQIISGWGEVLKYAYISEPNLLREALNQKVDFSRWKTMIESCVKIKTSVTSLDPTENGLRKILNFGHTIGHAFESEALQMSFPLLHGEAVAAGILTEMLISNKQMGLSYSYIYQYITIYKTWFKPYLFDKNIIPQLIGRMAQDKKNTGNQLKFVLISEPGKAHYDVSVPVQAVEASLLEYLKLIL